ncbi:MAG: adenylate/guanylate cyclase domain-containing protein [Verrucomicrobiota bacterium]
MDLQLALDQCERVEEFRRKHRIGLLTLLFTDMVGSTRLKQALGDTDGFDRIQEHHALVRETLAGFPEGEEIGTAGDSFFVVFAKPSEAVKFSLLLQSRLRDLSENSSSPLLDRVGIHIGEVIIEERPGEKKPKDLYGIQVDICARVMSLGQGDQILMTRSTFDNARQVLKGRELEALGPLTWTSHGAYLLQGVDEPLEVCEVGETGRACLTPPADSGKARRAETVARSQADGLLPIWGKRHPAQWWPILAGVVAGLAALLLIVGYRQGWFRSKPPATPLFHSGFEATEGYQAGQSVIGREGWMRGGWQGQLTTGGEGVAAGLFPGSAQQAFIGGVPGERTPAVHASLRRNVLFSPTPDGPSVVEMAWSQRLTDSTNGVRNSFEWLFHNQRSQLLGGLMFDNATLKIMSRRPDNRLTDTGLSFERDRVYPVKLQLDFRANTWSAEIGNATLGPLPLADSGLAMNLGNLAVTWWSRGNTPPDPGGQLTGDNRMAFDDLEITARD